MRRKAKDSHEFKPLLVEIEEQPLNPLGRTVFWIIIAAIGFFGLWMFCGRVDVVVTARGKVIPVGEVKTVQPLTAGVVRAIRVKPGDFVKEGQVLMEIDPSDIEPELESMKVDLAQVELEILRIESLLSETAFSPSEGKYDRRQIGMQQEIYESARRRLQQQIRVKKEELGQVSERLAATRKSLARAVFQWQLAEERLSRLTPVKDIISKDDYDKARSERTSFEDQVNEKIHGVEELWKSAERVRREIDLIRTEEQNRLLEELSEKRQRQIYLQAKIEKAAFLSSRQQITAPVRGTVTQLLIHTIGGVVTPAEKLAHIVPADSPLVIKALVLNKDVGFIAPSMDASIKIDTFNFQKYGLIDGTVLQVANDSIEDKNLGLVYETYIEPKKTTLTVEGVETPIGTGMSVTAEIKVGKRRIIEFFIYPLIKYLDEGISVR
ncbi:MAG: HlyD family type I secretion periplasmic adaptor subunit [Desulfobacterales bacterium]|nr:HlyD family type I secretion periplasmic adaptor subunit [Desulfobacterales bacterium]